MDFVVNQSVEELREGAAGMGNRESFVKPDALGFEVVEAERSAEESDESQDEVAVARPEGIAGSLWVAIGTEINLSAA